MRWPWWRKDLELERELAHHLDTLTEGYRRQGYPEREARRRARVDFGGAEAVKDECRELRWGASMRQLWRDVDFGFRMLRRAPGISAAALLSLALGIGATTAVLTLADAALWRTLPIPSPENFHEVFWESKGDFDLFQGSSGSGFRDGTIQLGDFFSAAAFEGMRDQLAGRAIVASHMYSGSVSAVYGGAVVVTKLRPVSGEFFRVLGIQPRLGRLLSEADDRASASPAAVVTYGFWERTMGADSGAIGKTMRVNNTLYEIAGVLPREFFGLEPSDTTEIYAPIRQSPVWLDPESWYRQESSKPTTWWLQMLVRREPGNSAMEIRAMMDAAFAASWPKPPKEKETAPQIRLADAGNGLGDIRRSLGNPMLILIGLVGLVLTVACANIANMLLARAVSREKEVALRVSLGCSEARLVRQLFTESVLLAGLGGALSIPIAWGLTRLMLNFMPEGLEQMLPAGTPDWRLLAATGVVALLAAVVFGLYPAFRGARVNAAPALKEEAGSASTMSRAHWAPAKALVLVQVALGVLLLSSAILFTGHLWEVLQRDTGFAKGNMLLFDIRPGEAGYEGERLKQFYLALAERLESMPGVEHAGLSRTRPMKGGGYWNATKLPGAKRGVQTAIHHVSEEFLPALGVQLVSGRAITTQEMRSGAKVAVISETLVKELKAGSPLGMRLTWSDQEYEVIGVAKDARYHRMTQSPAVAYHPLDLESDAATVLIRSSLPPSAMLPAAREALRNMDRTMPMVDIYTMEQQISRTLQRERMFAWLCGSFGLLALVLCAVGLFGLFSYTTARRRPEIGIRIAVGASREDVVRQVLGEGMRLAAIGLVMGVPLAVYCAWIAQRQKLLQLPEGSIAYWALGGSLAVLALSALVAVLVPAMRAASVDPIRAIRQG